MTRPTLLSESHLPAGRRQALRLAGGGARSWPRTWQGALILHLAIWLAVSGAALAAAAAIVLRP